MEYIRIEDDGTIFKIIISRLKALNAINNKILDELNEAISKIKAETHRILVITGDGEKSFVAGADIAEMVKMNPIQARNFLTKWQRFHDKLESLQIPVVALINGYALGGGLELALACDIRIATENAIIGLPEVSLGLIPSAGGTQRLTKLLGVSIAKSMILTGKKLNAEEAKNIGLIAEIIPRENKEKEFQKFLDRILSSAPIALASAKKAIQMAADTDLKTGQEVEVNLAAVCFATEDLREGMNAFLEKRKAEFKFK